MLHHPNIFFQFSFICFVTNIYNGMEEQASQLWMSTKDRNNPSHRLLESIRQVRGCPISAANGDVSRISFFF
jgi:hypothetical protein